ncbi:MAG: calcium/sodium antiporter [Nitrospinota bacterium]
MMMLFQLLIFMVGVLTLYFGAEFFIKGASGVAGYLRVTPLLIGLVVVSSATSAPELLVCLLAVLKKSDDISMGNIIGSNIANIGLILGVSAIISPIKIEKSVVKRELLMLLAASTAFFLLSLKGRLGFFDGVIFLGLLAGILIISIRAAKNEHRKNGDTTQTLESLDAKVLLFLVGGLLGLLGGAHFVVSSGIELARAIGISELIIAISVIAIGTSLPELAASTAAARRGEADLCVGNVLGSNLFNTVLVIGVVALLVPIQVTERVLSFHLPVMLIFSFILLPVMRTGFVITRLEGVGLLLGYFGYLGFLFI